MPYCAAFGCNNDARYVKTVSYHRFPEDQKVLKEWLAKIGRTDLTVTGDSRLCSDHFEPHCYERDLKAELLGSPGKRLSQQFLSIDPQRSHGYQPKSGCKKKRKERQVYV